MKEITLYRRDFKTLNPCHEFGESFFDGILRELKINDPDQDIDELTLTVDGFEVYPEIESS